MITYTKLNTNLFECLSLTWLLHSYYISGFKQFPGERLINVDFGKSNCVIGSPTFASFSYVIPTNILQKKDT